MSEMLNELREFIANRMSEGFELPHEIVKDVTSFAAERYGRKDLRADIGRLIATELAAHQTEQAEWERPTDCDRLDDAFDSLNGQGIVARQNFSCCNNCGFTEIWDEVAAQEKVRPVQGYLFYHLQCTEQAIKTGRLLMAYGSIDDEPEALFRVVRKIISELRSAGLNASWGGTVGHPIVVDGIVWRRRR